MSGLELRYVAVALTDDGEKATQKFALTDFRVRAHRNTTRSCSRSFLYRAEEPSDEGRCVYTDVGEVGDVG